MTLNFRLKFLPALVLVTLLTANLAPPVERFDAQTKAANKDERDAKLQADADALLPLFGNMPPVPVYLSDEAIDRNSGSNTEKGIAYTHCFDHETPAIYVKKSFSQTTNRKQLTNALKHELTHAWLCRDVFFLSLGHHLYVRRQGFSHRSFF
jgi:hypothetical protein